MRERIPFIDGDLDFWALYDSGKWEPETKAVLQRFLGPKSCFMDIGAWIGPVSLWAVELGADVVAFEPDPVAYPQLVHNTAGLTISPLNYAVVSGSERRIMLSNPGKFGDSMSRISQYMGIAVWQITPGVALAMRPKWELIKVDIEGGEIFLLPELAPLCAYNGIPLYVSWHEAWFEHEVPLEERKEWFKDFSHIEGNWSGTLLAIP